MATSITCGKTVDTWLRLISAVFKGQQVLEFGCNFGATAIMLALLGAEVTAVDINNELMTVAELNARRYGARTIKFELITEEGQLPFSNATFDLVTCASVLEYVEPGRLKVRLRELDRVLKPGGHLLVMGTSNRLAPQEVHSRRWLINYVPRCADQAIGLRNPLQRGIWPWSITDLFPLYRDLVLEDRGKGRDRKARRRYRSNKNNCIELAADVRRAGRVFHRHPCSEHISCAAET